MNRIACLVLSLGSAACSAHYPPGAIGPNRAIYDGRVSIDPAREQLAAHWRIVFLPDSTTRDSVTFLLNRGLTVSSVSGPAVARFALREDGFVVHFTSRLNRTEPAAIDIAYSGVPRFAEDSINRIKRAWIELGLDGFWHPVFAGYAHQITGTFQLRVPNEWQGVASGSVERAGDALRVTNRVPLIDLAFAAAPKLNVVSGSGASVYHVNADSTTIARVLSTSSSCAAYLNTRYGAREPLPHVKIVLAPRNGPGYARQNYIVITDVGSLAGDALARFLCHEFAHFWSTGAVASGPENWLNEAFAEFVAARYVREAHGADAYARIVNQWREQSEGQPPVWTPTTTRRPSARTAYRKAPYLLDRLEQRIGTSMMDRVLARRMMDRIATTQALLALIGEVAGAETAEWIRQELAK